MYSDGLVRHRGCRLLLSCGRAQVLQFYFYLFYSVRVHDSWISHKVRTLGLETMQMHNEFSTVKNITGGNFILANHWLEFFCWAFAAAFSPSHTGIWENTLFSLSYSVMQNNIHWILKTCKTLKMFNFWLNY